jgi:2-polyprenyl-3-methyl-5-hydroxy-6-metoxy-1,4-benzoquinol methylase
MLKSNRYNFIAPFYDNISALVFRNKIFESQISYLNEIPSNSTILFIGGGSGKTLKNLLELKPNCKVDYIESSEKMMKLAKVATKSSSRVNFILGSGSLIPDKEYDVILTFFFLDLFQESRLKSIHNILDKKLKPKGIWLVSDFEVASKLWTKTLELIMFSFLKIITRIESQEILDIKKGFILKNYHLSKFKNFYGNFIFSAVFSKQ